MPRNKKKQQQNGGGWTQLLSVTQGLYVSAACALTAAGTYAWLQRQQAANAAAVGAMPVLLPPPAALQPPLSATLQPPAPLQVPTAQPPAPLQVPTAQPPAHPPQPAAQPPLSTAPPPPAHHHNALAVAATHQADRRQPVWYVQNSHPYLTGPPTIQRNISGFDNRVYNGPAPDRLSPVPPQRTPAFRAASRRLQEQPDFGIEPAPDQVGVHELSQEEDDAAYAEAMRKIKTRKTLWQRGHQLFFPGAGAAADDEDGSPKLIGS